MARTVNALLAEKETTMTDEELEQQDKQEQKEEKKELAKRDLKIIITSIVCTLLFIIILLLLVLLGLKNCSSNKGDHGSYSSGSSSNPPAYNYDNELLNNQFIKIVNYERLVGGFDEAPTDVVAITYIDNYPNNFNINITAKAGNTIYYYHLDNYSYSGDTSSYDNCIGYILSINISDRLDGSASIVKSTATSETIETDKGNHYVISSAAPLKYFSGFYLDNNQYKVYNYIEFTSGSNPFNNEPSFKVNSSSPLYGYYQYLNQ